MLGYVARSEPAVEVDEGEAKLAVDALCERDHGSNVRIARRGRHRSGTFTLAYAGEMLVDRKGKGRKTGGKARAGHPSWVQWRRYLEDGVLVL